jgi:hypothetical protein
MNQADSNMKTRRTVSRWLWASAGLLMGLLLFISLRALLIKPDVTHHHANFALFKNGERDNFESFAFYEEVQGCSANDDNNPRHRVHMHNKESDTIHVHAKGATWGHFFANLGYGLTNDSIQTEKGVYIDEQNGQHLTFILNGQEVEDISNRVIDSEDVLLVSYGDPTAAQGQYSQIRKSAAEHNHKPDPASCSGSEDLSFQDRLKQAVDFTR